MNTITKKDIQTITSDNLFLAFIEPKKFATEKMLDFIRNNLSDENLKQIMKSSMDELCDILPTEKIIEVELKIDEEGEDKHIQSLRKDCFKTLEEYKEKRIKPLSHSFAILTIIDNKIYDFASKQYIDLNDYYINYITPFKEIFLDSDWTLSYNSEGEVIIILSSETKELIEMFINENQNKIDENAIRKMLKL